jgi:hypothetical protein
MKDSEGRQSETFKIFAHRAAGQDREDIYIAPRGARGMKVSLHATGARQVGLTDQFVLKHPLPEGRCRHYDTWKDPSQLSEGVFVEYAIRFATDHLRPVPPHRSDRKVTWIPAPASGMAAEVLICTTEPCSEGSEIKMSLNPGTHLIAAEQMTDRRFLILIGRVVQAGRPANAIAVAENVLATLTARKIEIEPSHRLLIGSVTQEGLRQWTDYSAEQFLRENETAPK